MKLTGKARSDFKYWYMQSKNECEVSWYVFKDLDVKYQYAIIIDFFELNDIHVSKQFKGHTKQKALYKIDVLDFFSCLDAYISPILNYSKCDVYIIEKINKLYNDRYE